MTARLGILNDIRLWTGYDRWVEAGKKDRDQ